MFLGPDRARAATAALINGTAAHALDYDDVANQSHPSVVLVPAILAQAEALGASGADAIATYAAGYEVWAELVLREPVLALRGDRFVLRDETARWTIGGGVVVHTFAERHRSGDGALVARLERLRTGSAAEAATTFVEMASEEDAQNAIKQLNNHSLGGRNLTVNEARPKPQGSGGFGGGGGGRGGGGGSRRREPRW